MCEFLGTFDFFPADCDAIREGGQLRLWAVFWGMDPKTGDCWLDVYLY